eukprot:TRINITY_DN27425_c0_g1_i2.p1 TRINITY_DN27425_c0_g1~~TRINITY_DN27425_c0_g1_i2.p1  ORF type:complete len:721 (-),score=151.67 TRINITY_DN27425_c0_g1_i2:109-2040(-)
MDVIQKVRCNSCSYESTSTRVEYCLCISCALGVSETQLESFQREASPKRKTRFLLSRNSKASPEFTVPDTSIEGLLKEFVTAESIDEFKCEKCSNKGCTRTVSIDQAPNVLILHVYRRQGTGIFSKLNRNVKFSERLEFAPFMSSGGQSSTVYHLYAVIVHREVNKSVGHYVSYIRDRSGSWYLTDDVNVESVRWAVVKDQDAYMLLYESAEVLPPKAENFMEGCSGASVSTSPGSSASSADDKKDSAEGSGVVANKKLSADLKMRGTEEIRKKEYAAAVKTLSQALELQHEDADLWLSRAFAHRMLRRWDPAEADAGRAVELDPSNARAHHGKALSQQRQGKLQRALASCKTGLAMSHQDKQLLQLRNSLEQAVRVVELRKRSTELQEKGDCEAALETLNEAFQLQPKHLHVLLDRLALCSKLGDWEAVRSDAELALEMSAKNAAAFSAKANALLKLGRLRECLATCETWLAEHPQDSQFLAIQADAHRDMEADDAKKRAKEHLDMEDFDEAVTVFSRAIELVPQDHAAWLGRAQVHGHKLEWVAAERDAFRALELDPSCAKASYLRGLSLQQQGDFKAASDACQAGLVANENDAPLLRLQAVIADERTRSLREQTELTSIASSSPKAARQLSSRKALIVSL